MENDNNYSHAQKADIHMHSTASDGGYHPENLMKKCADAGLSIVSLTDHDTTVGVEEALEQAKVNGMRFITGIELSTRIGDVSVDILGYGININSQQLQDTLAFHRKMRRERMDRMIKKCQDYGLDLEIADVKQEVTGETYSRPHLAKALIKKGYATSVQEVFEKYLGYGKPCYVLKEKELEPHEAIRLIHEAGGVAIVAHPIYYELDDAIYEWFLEEGLDGIEVYHRDHDEVAIQRFLSLAERVEKSIGKSVFKTGGSDFHHESFGRIGERLGITKLPYTEAEQLWEAVNKA